ncbi:L-threonylcarbamoyladenylate synthase [Aeoliella mucimassa]|uniref:L-threonylcarbamoyladenylate synthase n=1 Tax=Aeoliella mucimassa TaxID=2527972 RepID=A0A518ASL5_9BACT|nr:L-threonylcarbamoyladenylate synthase [Aeoliella mucimassa]QDU57710.1 Threonylcarbamoyl-AMP synthase [Aeoliella mucimassa]
MPPLVIDIHRTDDLRDVVHRAVQALVEGKLVAFPTETVYGVAASACNAEAVDRLLTTKSRDPGSPFALAIKSAGEARDYAPDMSPLAYRLARRCWPGPVTLVVDCDEKRGLVGQLAPSVRQAVCPQGTVGLRVPANQVLLDVLCMINGPLALTSANFKGEPEAINADDVIKSLGDKVDLVLDDGPARYGRPSSVVRVNGNKFSILREGVVGKPTLERLARYMVVMVCTGNTCRSPMAEALMRKALSDKLGIPLDEMDARGVLVMSAGLAAAPGSPPSTESVTMMKEHSLSIDDHRSQPLTDQVLRHADLVLTMTRSHLHAIAQSSPEAGAKTEPLMPGGEDVADPIGGPLETYRACAEQIAKGVDYHAERIAEIVRSTAAE